MHFARPSDADSHTKLDGANGRQKSEVSYIKNSLPGSRTFFGTDFATALGNTDEHVEAAARRLESLRSSRRCVFLWLGRNHFGASETFRTILPRVCRVAACSCALAASVSGNAFDTTTLIFFCSINFVISASSPEFGATFRSEP